MSSDNPYAAPTATSEPFVEGGEHFTSTMVEHLMATRPWVRFLAVLGFVGSAFMGLAAIMIVVSSAFRPVSLGPSALPIDLVAVLYLILAAVYVVISVQLERYASAIVRAEKGGGTPAVEDALLRQRIFWKTAGIVAMVCLALGGLAFVGGILLALTRMH